MKKMIVFGFLSGFLFAGDNVDVNVKTVPERGTEVLRKDFFDRQAEQPKATTTSPRSGSTRSYAEPADYTAEQRAEAIIECEPVKEREGLEAYRNCFKSKIHKKRQVVKDRIEKNDFDQQRGLKKTPTLFKGGIAPGEE